MADNDTSRQPRWYILKSQLTRYKADDTLALEMAGRKKTGDSRFPVLDYYVPHLEEKRRLVDGTLRDVSSPLGGYVFLRGTVLQVTQFCQAYTGFSKIRGLGEDTRFLSIRDDEMDNFKLVVRAYNARHENVPFISATPDFFEQGDTVRILDGEFRGVEGIFVTSRGKDSGHVVVKISNNFYVSTLEVRSSQLRILEFSDKNHHVYQKLDSFSPVLYRIAEHFLVNGCLDDLSRPLGKDKIKVERFFVRFGGTRIKSDKMRSRIMAYVLLSFFVLRGRQPHTDANTYTLADYARLVRDNMRAVTNPVNQAFTNLVLYAATGDGACLKAAEQLSAPWLTGTPDTASPAPVAGTPAAGTPGAASSALPLSALPLRKREVISYLRLLRRYYRAGLKATGNADGTMMIELPDKTFTSAVPLARLLTVLPAAYLKTAGASAGLSACTPAAFAAALRAHAGQLYKAVTASADDALLLEEFLSAPGKYIVRKAGPRFYPIQSLGLVATWTHLDKSEWHMLMPDEVRTVLSPFRHTPVQADLKS